MSHALNHSVSFTMARKMQDLHGQSDTGEKTVIWTMLNWELNWTHWLTSEMPLALAFCVSRLSFT